MGMANLDDRGEMAHDVGDRGRDHRLASGHVFQRLRRVDVFGRVIQCERHQAGVETFRVRRQIGVIALAKPVQIGTHG